MGLGSGNLPELDYSRPATKNLVSNMESLDGPMGMHSHVMIVRNLLDRPEVVNSYLALCCTSVYLEVYFLAVQVLTFLLVTSDKTLILKCARCYKSKVRLT